MKKAEGDDMKEIEGERSDRKPMPTCFSSPALCRTD